MSSDQNISQNLTSSSQESLSLPCTQPDPVLKSIFCQTSEDDIARLDMTRLREVIEKEINTSTAEILEENKINGRLLLLMKKDDITEIIKPLGDRLALLEFISKITKNDHNHDMAWLTTSSTSPQASTSSQASDITKKEFFEQKAKGSKAATQALRDWNCLNSKIRREVIATKVRNRYLFYEIEPIVSGTVMEALVQTKKQLTLNTVSACLIQNHVYITGKFFY
jgi:hypothetical protein